MKIINTIVWLQPWPRTCIMAWVHGNEVWAQKLLYYLSEHLEISYGEVVFVIASPWAVAANTRYIDYNLNRLFGQTRVAGYESTIIEDLEWLISSYDYVLDLHNTIRSRTQPFLITEHVDYAQYFDVEYVVCGLDALHPWASDGYVDSMWWVWLCLECGHIDDDSLCFADSVVQFLASTWHNMQASRSSYQVKKLVAEWVYHSLTDSFVPVKDFADFEFVAKGEIIGSDGWEPVLASDDCYLLFTKSSAVIGWECFVATVLVA